MSYDPTTRTLTRHVRHEGSFPSTTLPDTFDDAWLVAAGPDQVVYLNVTTRPGADGEADLVAISLAPDDTGRELKRLVGAGNPGFDADFVATPFGIVMTGWYQERTPGADDSIVMPWVERIAGDRPLLPAVPSITVGADGLVSVDDRTWELTGEAAAINPTGMPPIVATFDGGFIAHYIQFVDDNTSVVVRGWPDGSVTEWRVPDTPIEQQFFPVPEPTGTVLVPNGEWFARVAPFEPPEPAWDGQLRVDIETGEVDTTAINAFLAGLDAATTDPQWSIDPVSFANSVVGPTYSLIALRTIRHVPGATNHVVTVTTENAPDDSVYATRWTLTFDPDLRRIERIEWANSCQPGRGHQDYRADLCV